MKVADRIENAYLATLRFTFLFVATVVLATAIFFVVIALPRLVAQRRLSAPTRALTVEELLYPNAAALAAPSIAAGRSSFAASEHTSAQRYCANVEAAFGREAVITINAG